MADGRSAEPADGPGRTGRSRARRAIGLLVAVVVVVGTFGWVLPQVADYAEVWETIQSLSWEGLVLLVLVSAWNLASVGPVLMTAFPGLRFWEAMTVAQTGTSLSSAIPGGEVVAYGMQYRMYRSFRLSVSEVAQGLVISGMYDNVAKFTMPVIAFACIRVTGDDIAGIGPVAVIGVLLFVGSIALTVGVLRSEPFARRVGDRVGRLSVRPLGWLRRPAIHDLGERLVEFRREALALLRSRWHVLMVAAYASELSVYLVLLVALRLVGVSESEVSWSVVLACFALVRILQSVPITPGGVGVVELGLTGALVAAGGDNAEVVAGVLLFRAFTWLPPLVTGPLFYLGWRLRISRHDVEELGEPPSHAAMRAEVEQEALASYDAEEAAGPREPDGSSDRS